MFPLHGHTAAAALLILSTPSSSLGLAQVISSIAHCSAFVIIFVSSQEIPCKALDIAEALIGRQYDPQLAQTSGVRLTCTRAGWSLIAALVSIGPKWIVPRLGRFMCLWERAMQHREKNASKNEVQV
jgi:hypothetical protein